MDIPTRFFALPMVLALVAIIPFLGRMQAIQAEQRLEDAERREQHRRFAARTEVKAKLALELCRLRTMAYMPSTNFDLRFERALRLVREHNLGEGFVREIESIGVLYGEQEGGKKVARLPSSSELSRLLAEAK